jgi:hypothetical protein
MEQPRVIWCLEHSYTANGRNVLDTYADDTWEACERQVHKIRTEVMGDPLCVYTNQMLRIFVEYGPAGRGCLLQPG